MRFMILVKANKDSEAGVLPDEKILSEMGAYNEKLVKAGALLAAEGLSTQAAVLIDAVQRQHVKMEARTLNVSNQMERPVALPFE